MEEFRERQQYCVHLVEVMEAERWQLPDDEKALMRMLQDSLQQLDTAVQIADTREEDDIKRFTANIAEELPRLGKQINAVREQLELPLIASVEADVDEVLKFLRKQDHDLQTYCGRVAKLQEYQDILKVPVASLEIAAEAQNDLSLKLRLWSDRLTWEELKSRLFDTALLEIDVGTVDADLQRLSKTAAIASRALPGNSVAACLKESIEAIKPTLSIVADLRSDKLKERHWAQIQQLTGVDMQHCVGLSLRGLIEMDISKYQEEITTIATAAEQEAVLEEMMAKVIKLWDHTDLEVKNYKDHKDVFILGDISEVIAALDDSLVTVSTVLSSRYVSGIRSFVEAWRLRLVAFYETLDEWVACQKNWMYLESIFSSPDIIRQLPGPAKNFHAVDKSFRSVMKATADEPNALKCCTVRDRKELFASHNAKLDQIQKDLEDYLETKRMAFPRFYFLANDELLEILSQAKEPRSVQPHLRKCFENLVFLEFRDEPGSTDILGMVSAEGERVPLGKNLKARGNVEEWLNAVERRMRDTLRSLMKAGLLDYNARPRNEWVGMHAGQVHSFRSQHARRMRQMSLQVRIFCSMANVVCR
jgi:dynein heavy chain